MSELNFSLLEHLPEGVILIEHGLITAVNARARAILPTLKPGSSLPAGLIPVNSIPGGGTFHLGGQRYQFALSGEEPQMLLFFSPVQDPELVYLSGAAEQLRRALAPMMQGLAPHVGPNGDKLLRGFVTQAFYAVFRVVYNAEFLANTTVMPHPITVDLVSLCDRLSMEVRELLKELNVALEFTCRLPVLMISGDPVLLRRMLLELITNSIKVTAPGRQILLELIQTDHQAVLTLRDGGSQADSRRLLTAMSGQPRTGIPTPEQGAGMGLAVAQRIAALHRGTLMVLGGEDHRLILSLPVGPARGSVNLRTPPVQDNGGLDPLLLGLCDLVPSHLFDDVGLD